MDNHRPPSGIEACTLLYRFRIVRLLQGDDAGRGRIVLQAPRDYNNVRTCNVGYIISRPDRCFPFFYSDECIIGVCGSAYTVKAINYFRGTVSAESGGRRDRPTYNFRPKATENQSFNWHVIYFLEMREKNCEKTIIYISRTSKYLFNVLQRSWVNKRLFNLIDTKHYLFLGIYIRNVL